MKVTTNNTFEFEEIKLKKDEILILKRKDSNSKSELHYKDLLSFVEDNLGKGDKCLILYDTNYLLEKKK